LGEVGGNNLHALVQAQLTDDAHGAYQVFTEQHQNQYLGVAGGGLLECGLVVADPCAGERHLEPRVALVVLGRGGLAQ